MLYPRKHSKAYSASYCFMIYPYTMADDLYYRFDDDDKIEYIYYHNHH